MKEIDDMFLEVPGYEDFCQLDSDEWGRIIAAPFACARRGEGGDSGDPASVLYRRMRGRRDAVGATRTAKRAARCWVQYSVHRVG